MRVPVEWLRSLVELPDAVTTEQLADRLTMYDLKLEEIVGGGLSGPLTVGRVLAISPEEQKNGKTINWCRVDVGAQNDPSVPDAPGDDVPSRGAAPTTSPSATSWSSRCPAPTCRRWALRSARARPTATCPTA